MGGQHLVIIFSVAVLRMISDNFGFNVFMIGSGNFGDMAGPQANLVFDDFLDDSGNSWVR